MDKPADLQPARIITLGCRLNQADSALLTCRLQQMGYYLQEKQFDKAEILLLCNAIHASHFISKKQSNRLIKKLLKTQSKYEAKEFMTVKGLIWPLFVAGAFYLIFVGLLTVLFGKMEKKLDYFKS